MEQPPVTSNDSFRWSRLLTRIRSTFGYVSFILASVGAVAAVGGGSSFLLIKEIRSFSLSVIIIGAALLLTALMLSLRRVTVALFGIRGRYGLNTLIMIVVFVAIVVMVNFVGIRSGIRIDVTATKQFSLAPQTLRVLKDLKEPVDVKAFFVPTDPQQSVTRVQAEDLLKEFKRRSNKITFGVIDPESQPSIARQYEITRYGTISFEAMDSKKRHIVLTPPVTEQSFTTALLIVTGVQQKKVYYLTGHGERSMDDVAEGSQGYGFAVAGMLGDNYRVEPLVIGQQGQENWQQDAAVLVVAAPNKDLREDEKLPLYNYLKNSGRALFLLEPNAPPSFKELLAKWTISLDEGYIVDKASSLQNDPKTPILQSYQHVKYDDVTITDSLDVTFFPGVASLAFPFEDPPKTVFARPLALTTPDSWLETNAESVAFDKDVDKQGPLFPALLVQAQAPTGENPQTASSKLTNIVVFGDADFASNKYYTAFTNSDFLLNTINWLAEDKELISIRVKPFLFRELVVTSREFELIRWSSWLLMPTMLVFLGAVIWWRRR